VACETTSDRHLHLVPATGSIWIENQTAEARDGVAITGLGRFAVTAIEDAETVLVDAT